MEQIIKDSFAYCADVSIIQVLIKMNYICFQKQHLTLSNPLHSKKHLAFSYSPFTISQQQPLNIKAPDIHFKALLGIKMLDQIPFLLVAEEAEPCCNIGAATIYEIKKIDWVPIVSKEDLQAVLDKTEEKIKDMSKLFDEGFHYYSDHYKLNTTYFCNIMGEQNSEHKKFYSQFVFNESLMTVSEGTIASWCTPIIQGYIEQFSTRITTNQSITYTLISRRSNRKQGTRYFARGIDDKGNVANFTQTQQIISYGKFMISHLQIRGSVPAFFQQLGISGLSGELNITRNQAMTQKAFQIHFNKLHGAYDRIFCDNLLSIKKPEEQKLTLFYQSLISQFSPQYVRYEYFDFHQQCRNNQFQNAQKLVQKIKGVIDTFGVTVFDTKLKKLVSKQLGVVRTNCLDCLDRTNYMQSRIALYEFEKIIRNFSSPEIRDQINKLEVFQNKLESSSEVLKRFNCAWADNGDKISLHYTGIGSTHTDITKVGKRTIKGTVNHKMRSLMRFFVQFTDAKKNQAIQNMTHNPLLKTSSIETPILQGEFVNFALLSYQMDKNAKDKQKFWIQFTEDYVQTKRPAGVVIFAYRQNENSLLNWLKGNKAHEDSNKFAQQQIKVVRKLGYEVIKKVLNDNNCMLIFGNEIIVQNVTQIKNQNLSNHTRDTLTICKLNVYGASMVFSGANCTSFNNFLQLLEKSHDEAFQRDRLGQAKSSSILTQSYRTVLGNTSSGNKLSQTHFEQIKSQLAYLKQKSDTKGQTRLINQVLDNDELTLAIHENYQYLKNYLEGSLQFVPEGNRIIFWNKQILITKVLDYNSNEPIQCTFGHFSYQLH